MLWEAFDSWLTLIFIHAFRFEGYNTHIHTHTHAVSPSRNALPEGLSPNKAALLVYPKWFEIFGVDMAVLLSGTDGPHNNLCRMAPCDNLSVAYMADNTLAL